MKKERNIVNLCQKLSSLMMLVTLAWLTVSLPYVYQGQQSGKEQTEQKSRNNTDQTNNPLSNTTEEKTHTVTNTLSEYLHETHHTENYFTLVTVHHKCHSSALYFAFHPELISPPPEA